MCVSVYQGPGFLFAFLLYSSQCWLMALQLQNDFWNLSHHSHVQNRRKGKEQSVFLLVLFYQESKSLLRNSHNRLLLRVISQSLITLLPIAAREVEKVGQQDGLTCLKPIMNYHLGQNMLLVGTKSGSVSKAEGNNGY